MNWLQELKNKNDKFFWMKAIILALFLVIFIIQAYEYVQIKHEQVKLEQQLEELRTKNEALESEKARLQKPDAVEGLAREELGLVKPGEVPYVK